MTCAIPFYEAGTTVGDVLITPLTSMARIMAEHMHGGMTGVNITESNDAVGHYFDVADMCTRTR